MPEQEEDARRTQEYNSLFADFYRGENQKPEGRPTHDAG